MTDVMLTVSTLFTEVVYI